MKQVVHDCIGLGRWHCSLDFFESEILKKRVLKHLRARLMVEIAVESRKLCFCGRKHQRFLDLLEVFRNFFPLIFPCWQIIALEHSPLVGFCQMEGERIYVRFGNGVVKKQSEIHFWQLMEFEGSFCFEVLIVKVFGVVCSSIPILRSR